MNHNTVISVPVAADLSGKEGSLVKLTSTGLNICTSVSDRFIGTLERGNVSRQDGGSAVGMAADVFLSHGNGIAFVKVGDNTAWVQGDELEQGTVDGTVVKRAAGEVVGVAFDSTPANSLGGLVRAILFANGGGEGKTQTFAAFPQTLVGSDNGSTIYLNLAGGGTINLPAVAAGLKFKFVVKTAPTTAYIIVSTPTDIIIGYPVASDGSDQTANGNTAGDQLNFVANVSLPGDSAVFECDGTNWYVAAQGKATGAITITG